MSGPSSLELSRPNRVRVSPPTSATCTSVRAAHGMRVRAPPSRQRADGHAAMGHLPLLSNGREQTYRWRGYVARETPYDSIGYGGSGGGCTPYMSTRLGGAALAATRAAIRGASTRGIRCLRNKLTRCA